jgi:hypothetical protein
MPFRIEDDVVWLEGHCSVEEAQPLFDALRGMEKPIFELEGSRGLHTAIVQLILASAGNVRASPVDPVLAACFRDRVMA